MKDRMAFESRQNSYKVFSYVSNWLSCYFHDSLCVEFDYKGKAILKCGIFLVLSENFLVVHFFFSNLFIQYGGKVPISERKVTFFIPWVTFIFIQRNILKVQKSRKLQVFVSQLLSIYHMAMHSFNSHVILFIVLGGRLLHSCALVV